MKLFNRIELLGVVIGAAIVGYFLNPSDPLTMLKNLIISVALAHVMKAAVELVKEKWFY